MKLNLAIILAVGLLTYGITVYFDHPAIKPDAAPGASKPEAVPERAETGERVPAFSFTTLDGQHVSIGDFEGKTIILNFWATWCAPCVKEFPILIGIAEEYKDDVVFIALSSDLEQNAIERFLIRLEKDSGISVKAENILIALDENQAVTQKMFQTYRLPETILIDRHQKLRQKIAGADWKREDITSVIETFNQEP